MKICKKDVSYKNISSLIQFHNMAHLAIYCQYFTDSLKAPLSPS